VSGRHRAAGAREPLTIPAMELLKAIGARRATRRFSTAVVLPIMVGYPAGTPPGVSRDEPEIAAWLWDE